MIHDLRAVPGTVPIEGGAIATDVEAMVPAHDVIIQGTPVGMYPKRMGETCIPQTLLGPRHVVFDMVYRPMKTRLIREAAAAGCTTIPGLEMLVHQAMLQFERWTGVASPEGVMRDALLRALEE